MWKLAQIHFHQGPSIMPMKCFTTAYYKLSGDKTDFLSPNAWIKSRLLNFVRTFGQKCISYSTVACQLQHSFLDEFCCALEQWSLILMMLTSDPYYLLILYPTTKLFSSSHLMNVFLHEFLSVDFFSIVRHSDELLLFLRYFFHRLIDCFGAFVFSPVWWIFYRSLVFLHVCCYEQRIC